MSVHAGDVVLTGPGGVAIGVVLEVIGARTYVRLDDADTEHEVGTSACHALEPGRCWLEPVGPLAARLHALAQPWAAPQIESTTERVYAWGATSASDLVPRLAPAALACGFTVVGARGATQIGFAGHPDAPKLVLVVEDFETVSRVRAYDGERTRLAWLDPDHESLAYALLDALPDALEPEAALEAVRASEASAKNRELAARDQELQERRARREAEQVAAQQREEEEAAARALAARAARMQVEPDVDVDGFPTLHLPGRRLPRKKLLAALEAAARSTPNLDGARITASKGSSSTWEVTIEGAGETLVLGFERYAHDDDVGDDHFIVAASWPDLAASHSSWRDVESFPVDQVEPWLYAIAAVYTGS